MNNIYQLQQPNKAKVPILISVPHAGTEFPPELRDQYDPKLLASLDDTDWFVEKLYQFALELGITIISARYHRWVIDLNRDPENQPLYNDGRLLTEVVPRKSFAGENLYRDNFPSQTEITRRVQEYFLPYHQALETLLSQLQSSFDQVLLYEAHSIRRHVPTIHPEPFPDLIVGNNERTTASNSLSEICYQKLSNQGYQVYENYLFKGGYITRKFGKPKEGRHAIQVEMSKDNYMDEHTTEYLPDKARQLQTVLQPMFEALITQLEKKR